MIQRDDADPIVAFVAARCRLVLEAIEAAEPHFGGAATLRASIDDRLANGDIRALRTIGRGLFEMSRLLPPVARAELKARLDAQAVAGPFKAAS
jgi:hypothetical protein